MDNGTWDGRLIGGAFDGDQGNFAAPPEPPREVFPCACEGPGCPFTADAEHRYGFVHWLLEDGAASASSAPARYRYVEETRGVHVYLHAALEPDDVVLSAAEELTAALSSSVPAHPNWLPAHPNCRPTYGFSSLSEQVRSRRVSFPAYMRALERS